MLGIVVAACAGLVIYVIGAQRRIEQRLESIERLLGARPAEWE